MTRHQIFPANGRAKARRDDDAGAEHVAERMTGRMAEHVAGDKRRPTGARPRKRRRLGIWAGLALAFGAGLASYMFWWEPAMRLRVVRWRLQPKEWVGRAPCRIVILSDLQAGAPHVSARRLGRIIARANALRPDVAVVLGDLVASHPFTWGDTDRPQIIAQLASFRGRLGQVAVMGAGDTGAGDTGGRDRSESERGPHCIRLAAATRHLLEEAGITVLDDEAMRIGDDASGFWLAGLAPDAAAERNPAVLGGASDEEKAGFDQIMTQVSGPAPVVLLAHDPDVFLDLDGAEHPVPVQISGHTNGGQVWFFGAPSLMLASRDEPYLWGRYDEDGRTLIVSGGIGCAVVPMRLGWLPEITVVDLSEPEGW
ncbi:metallophosphoesterase [Paracoccus aminophilus]|uniref:Phosphohydrolase n=1 Tax=Paracoccus aminophilus JCM 7686 TaxID=1367847 RepID=S5YWZ8_PARAH|nr:metallophosphoesterase [Paracoccus aminophilus]AGT09741.1 phosphohydrolase [Paracoccus aminophilus JCM 7686]